MATEEHAAKEDKDEDKQKIPAGISLEDKDGDTGEGFPVTDGEDEEDVALNQLGDPEATRPAPSGSLPVSVSPPSAKQFGFEEKKTVPGGNAPADPTPTKPIPPPLPATATPAKPPQTRTHSVDLPADPSLIPSLSNDLYVKTLGELRRVSAELKPLSEALKNDLPKRKAAVEADLKRRRETAQICGREIKEHETAVENLRKDLSEQETAIHGLEDLLKKLT